ncbi:hypothetical protein OG218_20000 [Kineococcus sp. NBC_00420]|uniref:hypothetical protein n=1 Tax=Kineococcus sp. NBC_00420 TaxID=2903564 RepID=UPI002E22FA7D
MAALTGTVADFASALAPAESKDGPAHRGTRSCRMLPAHRALPPGVVHGTR